MSDILDRIDELIEKQMGVAQGPDTKKIDDIGAAMVAKITEKATADVQKVIYKAAKRAAKADNKPEGRMREWIAGKVIFAMKQWR